MAYRRIDITADDLKQDEVLDSLDDCTIIDHREFSSGNEDTPNGHTILVSDGQSEPVFDALREAFEDREGLRIVIGEVAAVWPKPEEDEEESDEDSHPDRVSREELLEQMEKGSHARPVYLIQAAISSFVAAIGMTRDSVALVIAAMVIAPLLLPNMAVALGVVVGDFKMVRRSFVTLASGLAAAFAVAVIAGFILPVDVQTEQLASRTNVYLSDLLVAFAAGTAGAIAVTTGVSANLIGVMVAVALVPPLTAIGLLAGIQEWSKAADASLLLGTNLVCVLLAAVGVYLVQGIRARTWYESQQAKRAVWTAFGLGAFLLAGLIALILLAQERAVMGK